MTKWKARDPKEVVFDLGENSWVGCVARLNDGTPRRCHAKAVMAWEYRRNFPLGKEPYLTAGGEEDHALCAEHAAEFGFSCEE